MAPAASACLCTATGSSTKSSIRTVVKSTEDGLRVPAGATRSRGRTGRRQWTVRPRRARHPGARGPSRRTPPCRRRSRRCRRRRPAWERSESSSACVQNLRPVEHDIQCPRSGKIIAIIWTISVRPFSPASHFARRVHFFLAASSSASSRAICSRILRALRRSRAFSMPLNNRPRSSPPAPRSPIRRLPLQRIQREVLAKLFLEREHEDALLDAAPERRHRRLQRPVAQARRGVLVQVLLNSFHGDGWDACRWLRRCAEARGTAHSDRKGGQGGNQGRAAEHRHSEVRRPEQGFGFSGAPRKPRRTPGAPGTVSRAAQSRA